MNRPPLLDEEQDELEPDYEEPLDGYHPLDFDSVASLDGRLDPTLEETLQDIFDTIEYEDAKNEIDKEEARMEAQLLLEEEE